MTTASLKTICTPQNKTRFVSELKSFKGETFPLFQDVLMSRISSDQEKVMAVSFALWNADKTKAFPITVTDQVLQMLGYIQKQHFKRDLLKEFPDGEGVEWVTETGVVDIPSSLGRNVLDTEKSNLGRKPETIRITGETFKFMAMRSNSPTGKATRSYYVALESILFLYMEAQQQWLTNKVVSEKDQELTLRDQQISDLIKDKDDIKTELENVKTELESQRRPFSDKQPLQSVYVFSSKTYEGKNLYKIGETQSGNIQKRVKQQQTGNAEDLDVVFQVNTLNSRVRGRSVCKPGVVDKVRVTSITLKKQYLSPSFFFHQRL